MELASHKASGSVGKGWVKETKLGFSLAVAATLKAPGMVHFSQMGTVSELSEL